MSKKNEYQVTGMTCGHCEMSVREEVSQVEGVEQVDVSSATGRLVVTSREGVEDSDVLTAVREVGYSAATV